MTHAPDRLGQTVRQCHVSRRGIGRAGLLLLAVLAMPCNLAQADSLFPEPGLTNPKLRFATGRVVGNQPEVSPDLPNIPGPPSDWVVGQWQHTHYLSSNDQVPAPTIGDARYGGALYAFNAPFDESHLWIFHDRASYVFELFERDGVLRGGGANLFLSAKASTEATLDKPIDYALSARISRAEAAYWTATAEASGAVMGQVFSGFVLRFADPQSPRRINMFLQIPIAASRPGHGSYRSCNAGAEIVGVTANESLDRDPPLAFAADPGPLRPLRLRLNDYVCAVITHPAACAQPGGRSTQLGAFARVRDLHNWRLQAMYVGLETQARDLRPGAVTAVPQGSVAVGVQLSGLSITRDEGRNYGDGFCH